MPYKSAAQARLFHERAKDLPEWADMARHWDEATRKAKKRKKKGQVKKMAYPFDNEGPEFNHKAARAMYDIVMKMDDDAAVAFAEIVISDVCEETIEKNLPAFQRRLDQVIEKRKQTVRKALVNLADEPGSLAYAKALTEISKGPNPYDQGYRFKESDFRRDPGTGQFQTKIKHTQRKPLKPHLAKATGVGGTGDMRYQQLTDEQKARYQDEYRQIAQFLGMVHASTGGDGNQDVLYHVRDSAGNKYIQRNDGIPKTTLYDPDLSIEGIVARPTALTAGGAAFGLMPALGGGRRGVEGVNAADVGFTPFANDWLRAGDPEGKNSNEKHYDRVGAGSKYLKDIGAATGNTKLVAAGRLGEFVGAHGREAEAVIGPSARKTAYRYRGTERTPDAKIVREYTNAVTQAKKNTAQEARAGRSGRGATAPSVSQMAAQRAAQAGTKPTWAETQVGAAEVADYLKTNRLPNKDLYKLQLDSGNTPPSEGVMIDRKGQITTQAVGYGDDHYLPFNLKNLKDLKGGQYIRTRSVGGLTSEDIYTGLIMGARQVTVVSRSGTFTVEFEEDFRGGRRHNDKARRMTRRYEQLLDSIQSEKVDSASIPPAVRQDIEDQVREESEGWGDNPMVVRQKIQQKIQEYKENPDLTPREREVLEARWRAATNNGEARDSKRVRADIFGSAMAAKQFKYRLDGNGYRAGMNALQEQFPYYIKDVRTSVDPELEDIYNPSTDAGYVEPGRNRPTRASAGLHGTSTNQGHKFSASQADYQGARSVARGGTPDSPQGAPQAAENGGNGNGKPEEETPDQKVAREAGEIKRKIAVSNAALAIRNDLNDRIAGRKTPKLEVDLTPGEKELLALPDSEFTKPENIGKFDTFLTAFIDNNGKVDAEQLQAYRRSAGHMDRVEYDKAAPTFSAQPYLFNKGKEAYSSDATFDQRLEELRKRDAYSITQDAKFSGMSDGDLQVEHTILLGMLAHQKAHPSDPLDGPVKQVLGATKGAPGLQGLDYAADIERRLEQLHRVRALKADMSDEEKTRAADLLKPGAVEVRPTPQTAEERSQPGGPQAAVDMMAKRIEDAAKAYEEEAEQLKAPNGPDIPEEVAEAEGEASALRTFLQNVKDQAANMRSANDVRDLMSDNAEEMERVERGINLHKEQQKRQRRGPTGTLREGE